MATIIEAKWDVPTPIEGRGIVTLDIRSVGVMVHCEFNRMLVGPDQVQEIFDHLATNMMDPLTRMGLTARGWK